MTDRVHKLTVALDHDIREDDVEVLVNAIKMLKWVMSVKVGVSGTDMWIAEERAKTELRGKILDLLRKS